MFKNLPASFRKTIYIYISIYALIICMTGCSADQPVSAPVPGEERTPQQRLICHAMGEIDGIDYTNCLEAFEQSYRNGFRYFEVDFGYTIDGRMVAVHDWERWDNFCSMELNGYFAPSYNDFRKTKILDKYTPLSLSDVINLMKKYDDIFIVTDTKRLDIESFENDLILVKGKMELAQEGLSDRLILQVYDSIQLETARKLLPPENIIFTMYSSGLDEKGIIKAIEKNNDLFAITIATWTITPEMTAAAEKAGIPVYVHTVNNTDAMKNYMDIGVYGFYTDNIAPKQFRNLL